MSSPAVRALSTARVVADILGYPSEFLQIEPRLYLATPNELLRLIGSQEDNFCDLLLVGHNPGMTELANRLVPDLRLHNLPTAGVIAMSFPTRKWSEVPSTAGALEYYDYPKNPELLLIED